MKLFGFELLLILLLCAQIVYTLNVTIVSNALSKSNNDSLIQPYSMVFSKSNSDMLIADSLNHRILRAVSTLDGYKLQAFAGRFNLSGYSGDGSIATDAHFNFPKSITSTTDKLFIADTLNHRIRVVQLSTNIISTIAGTGIQGFSGQAVQATSAMLDTPSGIAISPSGDIYIADTMNHVVRVISNGIISTFAGIPQVSGYSGDGSLATSAKLNSPTGLFVSSTSEVFVSDSLNHRIRKIPIATGIITTVVGNGIEGFSGDDGIAVSAKLSNPQSIEMTWGGVLYIADTGNQRIRKVSNNIITTIAGSGIRGLSREGLKSSLAQFNNPYGLSLTQTGGLFMADTLNNRILKITDHNCENCFPKCSGIYSFEWDVCSKNGTCILDNVCSCTNGFEGNNCEFPICYGNSARNSSFDVCSGRGKCNLPNECQCNLDYYGNNCQLTTCNEIPNNVSNVCSGNGKCSSFNNCTCENGYYGSNCEYFNCSNILFNSTMSCSSHGVCASPNHCECTSGFYGNECQYFDCFGVPSNLTSTCNGNGVCETCNTCSCQSGWTGVDCSIPICFGHNGTSPLACNSKHGQCVAPNKCSCFNGWIGSECSISFCTGILSINNTLRCMDLIENLGQLSIENIVNVQLLNNKNLNFSKFEEIEIKLPSIMSNYLNIYNSLQMVSSVSKTNTSINQDLELSVKSPIVTLAFYEPSGVKIDVNNLQIPIEFLFKKIDYAGNLTCMFYDSVSKVWKTDGLETLQTESSIICKTRHLTSFSVIDINLKSNQKPKNPATNAPPSTPTHLVAILASSVGGFIVLFIIVILVLVVVGLFIKFKRNKKKNAPII